MLKNLIVIVPLLSLCTLKAQTITLYGDVVDIEGDPAPYVTYSFKKSSQKFRTGGDGKFRIKVKLGFHDTLQFKSIRFNDYKKYIGARVQKNAMKNNDSLYLKINMPDKTTNNVVVRPNRPDTLFGTQKYSIDDFEFFGDGRMVLLTYEKTLKKGAVLRLIDENRIEIDKHYIAGSAIELSKDYRGNIHLLCEESVQLVYLKDNEVDTYLEDRDYYFKYVAPIIDSIGHNIYFSNYSDLYPAYDYYEFNLQDSVYKVVLRIQDTLMMELYRAEFKYVDVRTKLWAHQRQIETGIDKEIWVGAAVFTNSLYYRPLYAPLFKSGQDGIIVFDHYKNKMFRYTPTCGFVDSARISYHLGSRKMRWEQPLLQDAANRKIYAMFQKSGFTYLSEIDKTTGHVKKSFRLFFKYVDRIQISGEYVYYIYRPYESVQKKYIYREKLS